MARLQRLGPAALVRPRLRTAQRAVRNVAAGLRRGDGADSPSRPVSALELQPGAVAFKYRSHSREATGGRICVRDPAVRAHWRGPVSDLQPARRPVIQQRLDADTT